MRALSLILLVGAIAIPVAGCGGDDDDSPAAAAVELRRQRARAAGRTPTPPRRRPGEEAEDRRGPGGALKFNKSSLSAKAGKVTIVMDNPSTSRTPIEVEGNGIETKGETVTRAGRRRRGDTEARQVRVLLPGRLATSGRDEGNADRQLRSSGRPGTGEDCMIDVVVWPSTVKRSITSSRCSTSRRWARMT